MLWERSLRGRPFYAPGQGFGLRKNMSGALPLRHRTAHERPEQNNKAALPHVSFPGGTHMEYNLP